MTGKELNELELIRVKAENIELKNIIAGMQYRLDDWEDCYGVVYGTPNALPVDIVSAMRKAEKEFKD